MDLSTLGNCIPIIMVCYGVGFACKTFPKIPDERIPVIMLLVGGILGAIGMGVIPDFPATDYITAPESISCISRARKRERLWAVVVEVLA